MKHMWLLLLSNSLLFFCMSEPSLGRQLLTAAEKGKRRDIEQLLQQKAPIDFRDDYGRTPLHMALANNFFGIATCLLQHGAAVNVQNVIGWTPLMTTVYLPNDSVAAIRACRSLKRRGARFDLLSICGKNALMLAADKWIYSRESYKKLFMFLIEYTPNINLQSKEGKTALHYAAVGNPYIVLLLVDSGADTTIQDRDGKTPYDIAVFYKNKEAMRILSSCKR